VDVTFSDPRFAFNRMYRSKSRRATEHAPNSASVATEPLRPFYSDQGVNIKRATSPFIPIVFVLVVQLFEKVPALHSLAPTQTEPPFKISQLTVLLLFVVLGVLSLIRFRPAPLPMN